MHLTFLGIGLMGLPMTRRLLAAGHTITAWNRSIAKAAPLEEDGAQVEANLHAAVALADIVFTMLENGAVVNDVLFAQGAAAHLKPGALVIDMSSIKPAEAREHAARLGELGVAHLDAPVSGGTLGAENGTLAIMAGGTDADFARALPLLSVFGRATHVGASGAGQVAKLANQMIVGITVGAVAEALLFASKGGANMNKVRDAIRGGFAESRVLEVHGERMVQRDFAKRAALDVQLKDLRNVLATAHEVGFDAPITTLFESLYASASNHGFGDVDHSGVFLELARRNGA
jgi:3-hydroxyisobutyrate dehydrogenase-like beta-hydroxyacid dehydrogenase